ncbi:MAG: D-amino-acid transaminase [Peptococcaceae bacterium]|nr:D-amino-acid transaminase [Peptococcaceae bacterium]
MLELAWVEGEIINLNQAKIAMQDHGYFFGYGVYEVIKLYDGKPFAMTEHFDRLERSMQEIRIKPDFNRNDLRKIIYELIAKSGLKEAIVYLQVTRGVGPRTHGILKDAKPVLTMFISEKQPLPEKMRQEGVKTVILPDRRWAYPFIKSINLLPNSLAKQIAEEQNAYEAILAKENGYITEGASSNVFAVFDGTIVTHPTDGHILAGISRSYVLKIAEKYNYPLREDYFSAEQLYKADEVFLTSTTCEVLSVTNIDGKPVANGIPGPVTCKLYDHFMEEVRKNILNI